MRSLSKGQKTLYVQNSLESISHRLKVRPIPQQSILPKTQADPIQPTGDIPSVHKSSARADSNKQSTSQAFDLYKQQAVPKRKKIYRKQ